MHLNHELKYWLALNKIPELGPARLKILFDHFKSAHNIWNASSLELFEVASVGKLAADNLINLRHQIRLDEQINLDPDIKILTLSDPDYPKNLFNIYDPPPILYFKGNFLPDDSNSIAIVGTRKSTYYGEETTRRLIKDLAQANMTIISGLASGIDSIAHQAALDYGCRTIAVFGCGLNTVYPSENRQLAQQIMKNGALISEFEPDAVIEKWNFPRRNRIISGLSLGTLVVEGDLKSGALITAKYALDQNREIFAIPGNINSNAAKGPNSLIKQGAKLVESAEDILDELHISYDQKTECISNPLNFNISHDEKTILETILIQPKHIDNIALETNFPLQKTSAIITSLLLSQALKELPGKYFVACK